MAITTDFKVYPYSKVIRYVGNNDNVYTVAQFYSYLQNLFDEPGYMSYEKPIKYNTPTSYTMLNGWFLDNGDAGSEDYGYILEHLYGGSINTSGYSTIADPVYLMDLDDDASVWADFATTDKDKILADDATPVGPVLAFKNDYPSANVARVWVRDTRTTPATILNNSAITVASGTFTGDASADSISGDEVYANIYTISSWAGTPNPQVYVKQKHPVNTTTDIRVVEWSNADNWDRGTTSTEGADILLPVKLGGVAIDSGSVTLYARQTGDTFTHYNSTVSTTDPSRTPIAMETSSDAVNLDDGAGTKKAEHYLFYTSSGDPSATFTAGAVIQDVATSNLNPPSWYAEIVSHTYWTNSGVIKISGLRGTPVDTDDIYVGTSIPNSCAINGAVGGTYVTYDSEGGTPPTSGTVVGGTSGAKRVIKAIQDDGTSGKLCLAVDETVVGSSKDVYYDAFSDNEEIQESGTPANYYYSSSASISLTSDHTNITIAHVNGYVTVSNVSGTFEVGEVVNYTNPSASAICLTAAVSGSTTMYLGNVDSTNEPTATSVFTGASSTATADCDSTMTDANINGYNFSLQSNYNYSAVIEGGTVYGAAMTLENIYAYLQYRCRDGETDVFYTSDGSSITQVQGQFYITADTDYAVSKTALFGTLAGGVFFGAQGVWIQGMDSSDNNSIKLTDTGGTLREPYTSINVTVSNTRVGDRVVVYLEDGSTGLPDKDQFTSHATDNAQGDNDFVGSAGHPNDTPTANNAAYVTATGENEEHRYRYASLSTTNATRDTLVFPTVVTGTATAATTGQTLVDDPGGAFTTEDVEVGDFIYRNGDKAWAYVISIDSAIQLTTTVLSDGTAWAAADVYYMHQLVQTYDSGDKYYVPYLEGIEDTGTDASPGSISDTLTYVSARSVGVRVRNVQSGTYKIIPFDTTNDITNTGMSQSVIRNTDEVYA